LCEKLRKEVAGAEKVRNEVRKDVDEANVVIKILKEEHRKGSVLAKIVAGFRERCCQDIEDLQQLEELNNPKVRLG
jgi:hypothetical protein